ncbi:MAG TPA: dihydrolipoamide acetyltransferase family protein [Saprospiraceae bacterium]|nr:dihydrolipoamide acetyltransferase family protein [Saprospiraceae bacterium]
MAKFELIMPKMGESIIEATILNWVKKEGDNVEVDDTIVEIATDKVDSEVPSPVSGTITKVFFNENDTVKIGEVIAHIATEGDEDDGASGDAVQDNEERQAKEPTKKDAPVSTPATKEPATATEKQRAQPAAQMSIGDSDRFYSPLVKNIAQEENIPMAELDQITGSGAKGRVTKKDILAYIENRDQAPVSKQATPQKTAPTTTGQTQTVSTSTNGQVEIIEMDRMRKLIADHMVRSKQTSAHVTSFVEVDVTDIVNWRNKIKKDFQQRYHQKITYTPIFMEAVAKAIRDFPLINISVDENKIIKKKNINIGMATALPSGNLIVPVIKNADQLNLLGLTQKVNELANRARNNKLEPADIQEGTFTLTNVGTFGNVMGTPIINQPQVAIMAVGAIQKKPAVVETEYGDLIAVRHKMFISLSYDHRVVDGFLGGSFLRRVGDYLEHFDTEQSF